jgi:hypothetical protein
VCDVSGCDAASLRRAETVWPGTHERVGHLTAIAMRRPQSILQRESSGSPLPPMPANGSPSEIEGASAPGMVRTAALTENVTARATDREAWGARRPEPIKIRGQEILDFDGSLGEVFCEVCR